jgi:hypothetical protein
MRYRLSTLVVAAGIAPPLLVLAWRHGAPILLIIIAFGCYVAVFAAFIAISLWLSAAINMLLDVDSRK